MDGSGTIRVLKRDRSVELFDAGKLTAAIWRSMRGTWAPFHDARRLTGAIELYLRRRQIRCVSSSALFEMTVKALRHVGLASVAEAAEAYLEWRNVLRKQLRIRREGRKLTFWDKGWLCEFASRSWHISHTTSRILAGEVELKLLQSSEAVIARETIIDELNDLISQYGLADAVPVRQ